MAVLGDRGRKFPVHRPGMGLFLTLHVTDVGRNFFGFPGDQQEFRTATLEHHPFGLGQPRQANVGPAFALGDAFQGKNNPVVVPGVHKVDWDFLQNFQPPGVNCCKGL